MIKSNSPRVTSFVEWVRETQPAQIAYEFEQRLAQSDNPDALNLHEVLHGSKLANPECLDNEVATLRSMEYMIAV